jgi:hypothetical protein
MLPMSTFELIKYVVLFIAIAFVPASFFLATKGGFYDSDHYHGNGSAH